MLHLNSRSIHDTYSAHNAPRIMQCTDRDTNIKSNMAATQCAGLNDLRALPDDFGLEFFSSTSLIKISKERGYNYFLNAYTFQVKLEGEDSNRRICISAQSYRSIRKNERLHKSNIDISTTKRKIADTSFSCLTGYVSSFFQCDICTSYYIIVNRNTRHG